MNFFSSLSNQISNISSSQIAGWLSAVAAGALFIDCYIKEGHFSDLKSATPSTLNELVGMLENSTKPHIVRVSGKVGCAAPIKRGLNSAVSELESNSPITTLDQSEHDCVIYESTTEIVYEDRDSNGDIFTSVMEVQSIQNEVSWYLEDDTAQVRVEGIQKARGFDLVSDEREVAGPGTALLRELASSFRELDDRRGIKVLGVKHIERALKVDTSLMVVGKAVKEASGDITIGEILIVCDPDKYQVSISILFEDLSTWQTVSMFAALLSLAIFVDEGLTYFVKSTTPLM